MLAGVFLERLTIGGNGLLELCGTALALAEFPERKAEIVLRRGPVERDALTRLQVDDAAIPVD